jgi:hypothetical protein
MENSNQDRELKSQDDTKELIKKSQELRERHKKSNEKFEHLKVQTDKFLADNKEKGKED